MVKEDPKVENEARTFVQTAMASAPELDCWKQIGEEEVSSVMEMTRRNELSGGTPVVRQFEKDWKEWIGAQYGLTVFNGTSALYSAYFGLGVGPGDEVICPVNTWICTIAPAFMLGARPVFCDIDPDTLLMDPEDLRKRITPNTRCIVPVHLWGNVCDMDAILGISREYNIPVVEDCSHAHGAKYKGRMCGSLGDAGCWSLQGSKPVSAGEGGVLVTNNTDVFERACLVGQVNRIAGIDLVCERYAEHQPLGLGMKFRAHPLGIGIAKAQWSKLRELNRRRKAYVEQVEAGLTAIPGLRPVKVYAGAERGGFYSFPIFHDPSAMKGISTLDYIARVKTKLPGVAATPYVNLHTLPLFAKGFDLFTRNRGPLCPESGYTCYRMGDFPNAENAFARTIMLPILSDPVPDAAQIILDILKEAAEG
ncbi:MAG TPA: DegT/DnrJ/EryC1/StrS family aminotransferase [Candidatus Hydrogenedentes bacterium]|nr:DegT/DnrJ/EryC1/StrS family aminotransferase [Candidatus Hydrogenedentota bacterium]